MRGRHDHNPHLYSGATGWRACMTAMCHADAIGCFYKRVVFMQRAGPVRFVAMAVQLVLLVAGAWWAPCSAAPADQAQPFYGTTFERQPTAAELTELGRRLFNEPGLSTSRRMSCASCHSPPHGYGPANALSVQLGGPDGRQEGLRAVPSLRYRQATPPFSEHFNDTDGNDGIDQGPTGGRTWDGRADSTHEQAALPLLSPLEMANHDTAEVVARLAASPSAADFRRTFGPQVLAQPDKAWKGLLWALEVFQQSPADFYPYSSRYDDFLRGRADLSAAERRGLAVFNDPDKGNCFQCHPGAIKRGVFPEFTDHGLIALAVPRNRRIAANADPAFVDLGLCGPLRTDLKDHPEYCGLFKTPSLRNVAVRQAFFHNGVYHRLEDAVRFYAERDVHPGRVYPRGPDGRVQRFDDLPARYRANLNTEAPFGIGPQGRARLSEADVQDLVAFLRTLTDSDLTAARR